MTEQSYEFGNSGCLDITGQVVGLDGQPLAGISIHPGYLPGPQIFTHTLAKTDAAGDFTFRVWSICCRPQTVGPDTLSLRVRGVDTRTLEVGVPASVHDSVLVHATISPIGTIPTPSTVRLTLSAP